MYTHASVACSSFAYCLCINRKHQGNLYWSQTKDQFNAQATLVWEAVQLYCVHIHIHSPKSCQTIHRHSFEINFIAKKDPNEIAQPACSKKLCYFLNSKWLSLFLQNLFWFIYCLPYDDYYWFKLEANNSNSTNPLTNCNTGRH